MQISNLARMTRFWNNLHQVRSNSKDWKTNQFNIFESNETKGP